MRIRVYPRVILEPLAVLLRTVMLGREHSLVVLRLSIAGRRLPHVHRMAVFSSSRAVRLEQLVARRANIA